MNDLSEDMMHKKMQMVNIVRDIMINLLDSVVFEKKTSEVRLLNSRMSGGGLAVLVNIQLKQGVIERMKL